MRQTDRPTGTRQLVSIAWSAAPRAFTAATLAAAVSAAAPLALRIAIAGLVDRVATAADRTATGNISAAVAAVAAVYAANLVASAAQSLATARLELACDDWLKERAVRALHAVPDLRTLERSETRDLVAQARGSVFGGSIGAAAAGLFAVWPDRVAAVVAAAILFPHMPVAACVLVAASLGTRSLVRRAFLANLSAMSSRTERLRRNAYLRELHLRTETARELRLWGITDWVVARMHETWLQAFEEVWRDRRRSRGTVVLAVAVAGLAHAAAFANVAYLAVDGQPVATIALVLGLIPLVAAIGVFGDAEYSIERGLAGLPSLRSLEALAGDRTTGVIPPVALAVGTGQAVRRNSPPEIAAQHLRFAYEADDPVLKDVSLKLEAGRSHALVGVNGSGKSTLVKLLLGLYEADGGIIHVDGVPLGELDKAAWRNRVACVFQDFTRFDLSLLANVAAGAGAIDLPSGPVLTAAMRAGLGPLIERLDGDLSTVLAPAYENGTAISGGEWQRVALARAFLRVDRGADVLVFDEPTASLDVELEAEVFGQFLSLVEGTTSLLISHRLSNVRRVDTIFVLDGGSIVETGTHEELVARGGRYARMYDLQARHFASVEDSGERRP